MEHRRINFLPTEEAEAIEPPRRRSWLFLLLGLFACVLISGGILFAISGGSAPNEPDAYDPVTLEPKEQPGLLKRISRFVFSDDTDIAGKKEDRINVLLLGMGGPGHDGPYLTDTIIIASIKPSTGDIAMISIPRDLGVDIPGEGWRKINHANHFGEMKNPGAGGTFASHVIEQTFDIDIQYYVRVDFAAFEHIINDVGGITIDVERSFTDTQYPAANYLFQTVSFSKGLTSMDGATALTYARSRHGNNGEGSDFARARRQQKMLLALKEKILSFSTLSNPVRIHSVLTTLDDHIATDMEFSDIIGMIKLGKNINTNNIATVVLDSSPEGYLVNATSPDGAFMLSPKSGSFTDINLMIDNVFTAAPSITRAIPVAPAQEAPKIAPAIIEIQNGTWQAGLAARVGKLLQNKGISVTTLGNTTERPQLSSGIYKLKSTASADMLQTIRDELKIPIKQLPESLAAATSTEILIILGEDFEE